MSEWTIMRLYPDPIAGERVNIGVIVLDGEFRKGRMLTHWGRVRSFAYRDWANLWNVIGEYAGMTANEIRWQASNGNGPVQFDLIQPSLEEPDALLNRLAARYLKDEPPVFGRLAQTA